jgi:hypothetical protein
VLAAVAGAIGRLEYDPARGAFRNWLFTVVRRKLINWRAAQGIRPQGSGDTDMLRLLEQQPAPAAEGSGKPIGRNFPLERVIGVYLLYLLPYIAVSYYERYAVPLLGAKVLLVTWAADRLASGQPGAAPARTGGC